MMAGRRSGAAVLAAFLAVATAAGCSGGSSRPNVILVVLDTMRADRLGAYGARRPTPFLDKLAEQSIVYDRAYAPSSWTVPSIASVFTAQYPSEHRVAVVMAVLPDDVTTLAEELRTAGYRTGAFSANIEITESAGFDQGFDTFRTVFRDPKDDAANLNQAAFAWLDEIGKSREPVFMYLQYMEPHSPYRFHPNITPADPPPFPGVWSDWALAARVNEGAFSIADGKPLPAPWNMNPAELARLATLYDGEVLYLDRALANLFTNLDHRGLLENALIIVTADHGEHLGEHGLLSHGNTLYEEVIRVPLLVRLPRPTSRRVREPVSIAGLAPAMLRELGLPIPAGFHIPALPFGGDGASGFALSEVLKVKPDYLRLHRRALVGATGKLLVLEDGSQVFIDLATDPAEDHPLTDPPFAAELRRVMAGVSEGSETVTPKAGAPIDAATREKLRVLGYTD
jgi:choline-sulfatase